MVYNFGASPSPGPKDGQPPLTTKTSKFQSKFFRNSGCHLKSNISLNNSIVSYYSESDPDSSWSEPEPKGTNCRNKFLKTELTNITTNMTKNITTKLTTGRKRTKTVAKNSTDSSNPKGKVNKSRVLKVCKRSRTDISKYRVFWLTNCLLAQEKEM